MSIRKLPLLSNSQFDLEKVNVPQTITIQTNDVCQLECVHCYLDQHKAERKATFTQPEDLITYLKGLDLSNVKAVYFVGAEIGLRPDLSNQLMKIVRDKFSKEIEIVTNASFKQEVTEKLIQGLSPNELTLIKISIDGIRATTHDRIRGKTGSLEQILTNIKLLQSRGFHISPQMTVMPGNYVEALDSMDFFRNLGVKDAVYHSMSLEGKNMTFRDQLDPIAWRALLDKMITKDRSISDFDIKVPIILYTKEEITNLVFGDKKKAEKVISAIDDQEKGELSNLPYRTCIADPSLNQYFYLDKDVPVSSACTIKSNASRNYGGATYLTWDKDQKRFVRSPNDEMDQLYNSPYLCPAVFDAIKLKTNRVGSWIFPNAEQLYYSCRYPSYPNLPITTEQFSQYYQASLDYYADTDAQLVQIRRKHEDQFGK